MLTERAVGSNGVEETRARSARKMEMMRGKRKRREGEMKKGRIAAFVSEKGRGIPGSFVVISERGV